MFFINITIDKGIYTQNIAGSYYTANQYHSKGYNGSMPKTEHRNIN